MVDITIVIVPMRENYIVERLGKFKVVLGPGIHILIPFKDKFDKFSSGSVSITIKNTA